MSTLDIQKLLHQLPESLKLESQSLLQSILENNQPLQIILLGGFSVGKSSLLNMLLGEQLLFTALEEATSLPTFIEYGDNRNFSIFNTDRSEKKLSEIELKEVTTQAPVDASFASVKLPLDWLQQVAIIDLPGLGSISDSRKSFTLAQIKETDVVLYLLENRGPTQSDIEMLQQIKACGKRVKILVTKWDIVENAVANGEKMPSLEDWSNQIFERTGIKSRLEPVHQQGLGKDEILDFLSRAKQDISAIRLNRVKAELMPILNNALAQNQLEQSSCEAESEEQIQQLHNQLMELKQQLIQLKSETYQQQQQEREKIDQKTKQLIYQQKQSLEIKLNQQAGAIQNEEQYNLFLNSSPEDLTITLGQTAKKLSEIAKKCGEIQLSGSVVHKLNLQLPAIESIDPEEFNEFAKLKRLQEKLEQKQAEESIQAKKTTALTINTDAEEQQIKELMQQRSILLNEPLPQIIKQVNEGSSTGRNVGRFAGELADIALMFIAPTAIAAKVAGVAGKTAGTIAKTAVTASKMAKTGELPLGIHHLEKLTVGYWGEHIGSMFDTPPTEITMTDPEEQQKQQRKIDQVDQTLKQLKSDLNRKIDLVNEQNLSKFALEQNQFEQQQLKIQIESAERQLKERHLEAELQNKLQRVDQIKGYLKQLITQLLRNFDQQTSSMSELLHQRVKDYWDIQVAERLQEQIQKVEAVDQQKSLAPEEKNKKLQKLVDEFKEIESVLKILQNN